MNGDEEHLPEDFYPEPSEEVETSLDSLIEKGEEIISRSMADIDSKGNYGRIWVFLTKKHLMVIEDDGEIKYNLQMANLQMVEIRDFVGNGLLTVLDNEEKRIDVVRFSRTRSKGFLDLAGKVAEVLRSNGNAKDQEDREKGLKVEGDAGEEARRCPKCGRPLPKRSDICPHCVEKRRVFRRLLKFVRPYWIPVTVSFILTVFISLANLVPAILLRDLIDGLVDMRGGDASAASQFLGQLALFLGIVYATSAVAKAGRRYLNGWLGEKITFDIRKAMYRYLQMLSLRFYDRKRTGELISRVKKDSSNIRAFLIQGSQKLLVDMVTMVAISAILFSIEPRIAAVSLLPVPILALGTSLFAKKIHRIYHRVWRSWAKMSSVLADTIPGILVVKAFAQEDREVNKFEDSTDSFVSAKIRTHKLKSLFFPAMGLLMYMGSVIVYWWGGILSVKETITIGTLTLFVSYLWRFYQPVQRLSQITDQIEKASTAGERIYEVLDTTPEVRDANDSVKMEDMKGAISFEDVSFSYNNESRVLEGINLEVEPGEMVGLAGPSGSGKSTLVKLISRFYDPDEGKVSIDGVDVRKIKQRSLRERIGVVLQEPFLFHGSIAENISYARPKASREEIIQASKAANAHSFIMRLPEGYDTQVGERGARLSGGEKQRISIARAIINKPSIIVLDEATSSVDTATERSIQEALERLIEGRTTIAIAHRLSTLRNADKLIIMEDGKIVERGKHEELLEKDGVYANLVRMQGELAKANAV